MLTRHTSVAILLLAAAACAQAQNKKVLLEDIQVLTLSRGKMTTGRRSAPVPQIKCVGGDACSSATIERIQCYNRGFDGRDVNWECKAELEDLYRFGSTDVSCEGYSHKNDKYVLAGSCGVEYTLYLTEKGKRAKKEQNKRSNYYDSYDSYDNASDYEPQRTSWIAKFIWMVVAGIFLYSMYNSCMQAAGGRPRGTQGNTGRGGGNGGGGGWGSFFGGPGFGGGGSGSNGGADNCDPPMNSQQRQQGPGFWSGLGLGGLLGSMLNRPSRPAYYGPRYGQGSGFGAGPSMRYRPAPSYSGSSSSSSSSTRTASGYGGTNRR